MANNKHEILGGDQELLLLFIFLLDPACGYVAPLPGIMSCAMQIKWTSRVASSMLCETSIHFYTMNMPCGLASYREIFMAHQTSLQTRPRKTMVSQIKKDLSLFTLSLFLSLTPHPRSFTNFIWETPKDFIYF